MRSICWKFIGQRQNEKFNFGKIEFQGAQVFKEI